MVFHVGDLCVARSARHRESYNCVISKLPPNCSQDKALLEFIEYGETEEIPIADLQPFGEFAVNKRGELVRDSGDNTAELFGGWKVGDRCVAWWSQDDTWNKATILKVFSPAEVLVRFTDFGNADFSALEDLKNVECEVVPSGDSVTFEDLKPLKPPGGNSQEAPQMDHCNSNERLWKEGDVCVAQWKEDGIWYNSKIVEINQQDVLVEFVDYGNQDYTTREELKPAGTLKDIQIKDEINIESGQWKIGDLCVSKSSKFDGIFNSQVMKVCDKTALVSHIEFTKEEEISLSELKPFGDFAVNRNGELMTGMERRSAGVWTDSDLCVALWDVDNNWYNAKILKIFAADEVLVLFIDHGNADFARIADLKPAGSSLGTDEQGKCNDIVEMNDSHDDCDVVVEVERILPPDVRKVWQIGDSCMAKCRKDGRWYESQIKHIVEKQALVKFLDLGIEDYTNIDDLKLSDSPGGDIQKEHQSKNSDNETSPTNQDSPRQSLSKTKQWIVGDKCVAMWVEDGEWYNSKILEINGEKVFVQFVDYGNEDYTTIGQLKLAGSLDTDIEQSSHQPTSKESIKVDIQKENDSSKWKVGDKCVAMWDEDGEWYNSKILEINGEKVFVQFVDYGNEDYTTIGKLKPAGSLDTDVKQSSNQSTSKESIKADVLEKTETIGLQKEQDSSLWKVGDKCVAIWNEDGVWYNSNILEINEEKVLVQFVDYGNEDYTTIGKLKPAGSLKTGVEQRPNIIETDILKKTEPEKLIDGIQQDKDSEKWKVGDKCVAKWSEDNVWYTSQIMDIDGDKVKVKFLDYGNEDFTTLAMLKPAGSLNEEKSKEKTSNKSQTQNCKDQKAKPETQVARKIKTTLPLAKPKTMIAREVSTNLTVKSYAPTLQLENPKSRVASKITSKLNHESQVESKVSPKLAVESSGPETVVARKVSTKQEVNLKVPIDKIQGRSKATKDSEKWMPGDKVVAYWEKDKKWRRAIIQEVENDQAFVVCPDENMVRATWVKVTSLKPKSSSLDYLNQQNKLKPLATSEKNVQAWIDKHHSESSKENIPDTVQVENSVSNELDSQLKKIEISPASIPPVMSMIKESELEKRTIIGLGFELENRPKIEEKNEESDLENKIKIGERPNLVNRIMSGKGSSHLVNGTMNGEGPNIVNSIEEVLNLENGHMSRLEGRVLAQAFTSSGSRYLQSVIPGMKPDEIYLLQAELMTDALSAMNHSTATFVIQKLIEVADSTSMEMFVSNVEKNFPSLSLNPAGCRVVQKCLHVANPQQQTRIILQLENYKTIISLLRSKHGTYVAQACLPIMPVRTITFIVNSLLGHMVDIGRNQHGTYFLQQMLGGVAAKKVGMELLVEEIVNNVGSLAHDKFGTHLLQCVLPLSAQATSRVSTWVSTNMSAVYRSSPAMFLTLALIKRLFITNNSALMMDVIAGSLVDHGEGPPLFIAMSLHPVGHLLAKEILSQMPVMSGVIKSKLLVILTKYADVLKTDSYGCIVLKSLHGLI